MVQDRKVFRKKLFSTGSIYLAGEVLDFTCHDVSTKGTQIELEPGKIITTFHDVESAVKDISLVDIFISELQITGPAKVVWVKQVNNKILLGLEFGDVILNAQKLWRQRSSYRKNVSASGCLIIGQIHLDFECRNISADGLVVSIDSEEHICPGMVVEIESEPLALKGIATIIWINRESKQGNNRHAVGLRYLRKM